MPRPIRFNPPFIWLRAALLAFLLGTVLVSQDPRPRPQPHPQPVATLDRSDACSGTYWLGELIEKPPGYQPEKEQPAERRPALSCPPGWEWVFASRSNPGQPPPPGLQRFCRYLGRGDPRPRYRYVKNPYVKYHYFKRIEKDCRIVGPAAETIFPPSSVAPALRDRFLKQAQGNGQDTAPLSDEEVRLVIVDSVQDDAQSPQDEECKSPTEMGQLECSSHGEILVKLARELLCNGTDCNAQITTRRALAWTHEIRPANLPPNAVQLEPTDDLIASAQGGFSGTADDLATAIRREVEAWWEEWKAANQPRLILNLSVGWEPINASEFTLKAGIVRAAIEDAVCRGALVIAAAGNRVAGPSQEVEKPLLPAAWEHETAPGPGDCQLEASAQPQVQSNAAYRPLVFAVGGVQHDDKALSNARPNATPRLVAFGDHASVFYPGPPTRMKILTGTSVSTLVVSAAVAERWRKAPQSSSFKVMQDMWNEPQIRGTSLSVDFRWDGDPDPPPLEKARRIFVFSPAEPTPPQSWPPAVNNALMTDLIQSMGPPQQLISAGPSCHPATVHLSEPLASDAVLCPQNLFDVRSEPWLGPQPEADHNPPCSYSQGSPGTLVLEFDPCYRIEGRPAEIGDFTLIVGSQAYRLPIDQMQLGDPSQPCPLQDDPRRVRVVLTGFTLDDPPHPMYLAVTVNGQQATLSPILQILAQDQQSQ